MVEVMAGVLTGVLAIRSRAGNGRRETCRRVTSLTTGVGGGSHTVRDIDPDVSANVRVCLAFELTQAAPQSCCLKDVA